MKIFYITCLLLVILQSKSFAQYEWDWNNPLPTHNYLLSNFFIDSMTGWAVGGGGTILKSEDGGINWVLQHVLSEDVDEALHSVYFADQNNGWIVGDAGTILKTTDGGDTWIYKLSSTSYELHSVHFIDIYTGWAVGCFGTILKTTNGGEDWYAQISGTVQVLDDVFFTDSNNGWIVGGTEIFHTVD